MTPTNDTTGRRIAARAKELETPMIAFLRDEAHFADIEAKAPGVAS